MTPIETGGIELAGDEGPALMRVEYLRLSVYFRKPQVVLNLLLVAVCQLIPIVGVIVTTGYQYELIEALHRRPRDIYPEFDFNRFADYLSRGVWPFLVAFVASLVGTPIFMALIFGWIFGTAAIAGGGADSAIAVTAFAVLFVLVLALMIAMWLLLFPMSLCAGLMQEFAAAFDFRFARDFVSTMWLEMILAAVFLMGTALVLSIVGYLAFCIGIYVAVAAILFAQAHLQFQLYEVYLSRGGEPIPLKY